jgi:hypothetical protein
MRSAKPKHPHWNTLYGVMVGVVLVLLLEHHLHLNALGHQITLLLVVLGVYGVIGLWIVANAAALEQTSLDSCPQPRAKELPEIFIFSSATRQQTDQDQTDERATETERLT